MQAPIHIFLDHGFGQVPTVGLEEAAQRLGQQLVHVRRPTFLDERSRAIRQFGRQLGLNHCCSGHRCQSSRVHSRLKQHCRDPDDDKFLELALASGARAIVTGDADMLVLDPWRDIRIVKLTEVEMVILPTIATG
jgi:hypothetical protein